MRVNCGSMNISVQIVLVTVASILSSIGLYYTLSMLLNFDIRPSGFIVSTVCPLIIAPVGTYFIGALAQKNFRLGVELQEANEKLKDKNQELEKALQEVKTLKGFIPICSICRKIRNDDGYWHVLEEYIVKNTDAKLSHGICPTCLQNSYPEVHSEMTKHKPK